ncbi:HNH endonuclease [Aliikangiella marina]|uniref:HNH endonuclease n=1 Tax=Aliikangiella marina TaxID=1712262 RepID=A0A545THH4_9GAMM|nr:HNH endonuclease signature motif containing protein [Aliikangiella marina]TQV76662.1 HNH endonuclease [Aliikangiella marina]
MPKRLPTYCRKRGCNVIVDKPGYCKAHQGDATNWGKYQRKQGNTTDRGYGAAWRKTRVRIKARAKGLCEPCKEQGFIHLGSICDHIIPKAEGGTDDESNLQWVCDAYHKKKTAQEGARGRKRGD